MFCVLVCSLCSSLASSRLRSPMTWPRTGGRSDSKLPTSKCSALHHHSHVFVWLLSTVSLTSFSSRATRFWLTCRLDCCAVQQVRQIACELGTAAVWPGTRWSQVRWRHGGDGWHDEAARLAACFDRGGFRGRRGPTSASPNANCCELTPPETQGEFKCAHMIAFPRAPLLVVAPHHSRSSAITVRTPASTLAPLHTSLKCAMTDALVRPLSLQVGGCLEPDLSSRLVG